MADHPHMSAAEFQDLVDRFGPETDRWPASQQAPATLLLGSSAEARRILAEAAELKRAAHAEPIKAPAGLADRIVAKALGKTQ